MSDTKLQAASVQDLERFVFDEPYRCGPIVKSQKHDLFYVLVRGQLSELPDGCETAEDAQDFDKTVGVFL